MVAEPELGAKSWRLVEPGEKMVSNSLSAVDVLMMEVSAVRTEGSVKSRDERSPPDANALRMADMLTVSGVWCEPSEESSSCARPGSGSARAVEDEGLAGGSNCGSLKKYCTMDGGVSKRASLKVAGDTVAWNLMNEISEARSQGSKATDASVPSDFKNPRQLKLSTWKKASESWRPTRLASSEAEAEELTGMLVAYACWMAETES